MAKVLLGLGVAVLWGLLSATALAQSPKVTISDVERQLPHGDRLPFRINTADCLADDSIVLTMNLEAYIGYALEVWAGEACDAVVHRIGATASCWRVYSAVPSSIFHTATIRVRDLLAGRTRASSATRGELRPDSAECKSVNSSTNAQALTAYVLLVDSAAQVGGQAILKTEYLLNSPPPPDRVSLGIADGQLLVAFGYDAQPLAASADDVQFFCDPPPHDPSVVANATVTTSDAGMVEGVCRTSAVLIPGAPAAALQHLRCGGAKVKATVGIADRLVNGVPYNVAVATVDTFANVGPLSLLACEAPQATPANDRSVRACSFAGAGPAQSAPAFALLVALGAALTRRRQARSS